MTISTVAKTISTIQKVGVSLSLGGSLSLPLAVVVAVVAVETVAVAKTVAVVSTIQKVRVSLSLRGSLSLPQDRGRSRSQDRKSSVHHTKGRGQPQPWAQPQPPSCRSSQDRIHRSIFRIRILAHSRRSRKGR